MKNKELKQKMLNNGTYQTLKNIDKLNYKATGTGLKGLILDECLKDDNLYLIDTLGLKTALEVAQGDISQEYNVSIDEFKSYLQMDDARRHQAKRLYKHVDFLFKNNFDLVFATFTFNDKAMKLKENTRYQKVIRSLSNCEYVEDYILNIDYGKENEREHYHAIIALKKGCVNYSFKRVKVKDTYQLVIENMPINYDYGFTTFELIGEKEKDRKKVTIYTSKLSLHALKVKQSQLKTKRKSQYHDFLNSLN